jgi:hypothetical protein
VAVSFHHRRVQERLVALDVSDPQPVRSIRMEVAGHQIVTGDRCVVALCCAATPPAGHAAQALAAHQPFDTFAPDADPGTESQLGVDPWRPVGASRTMMDLGNELRQLDITLTASTWSGLRLAPLIEPADRDLKEPARPLRSTTTGWLPSPLG